VKYFFHQQIITLKQFRPACKFILLWSYDTGFVTTMTNSPTILRNMFLYLRYKDIHISEPLPYQAFEN